MQAIEMNGSGSADVLCLSKCDVPQVQADEVLIKVAYAGVNRPDVLQRQGLYMPPADASATLGLEASGVIVAVGATAGQWSVGDKVCALLPGGGYAEYAKVNAGHVLPLPKGLPFRDAACLPETVFTVWSNVFMRGGLKAGERVLIHGGSSGIGTTAIQLARAFGARVFVTAGSEQKCETCIALGAEQAINYRDRDFVDAMREVGGANVILDMVGGEYLPRNLKSLAVDGRLVNIAFLKGAKAEINIAQVMLKRLSLTGSNLRPQSIAAKSEIACQVLAQVWPLIEAGHVRPVVDRVFTLAQAADAHRYMEAGAHIGKIVLEVDPTLTA